MCKILLTVFFSLVCVTANLNCSIWDEIEGFQCLENESLSLLDFNFSMQDESPSNWAGYVAAADLSNPSNGSVTAVTGSWIVPTLKKSERSDPTNCVSVWVGMDGYSNPAAEQLGTAHWMQEGHQTDVAWYRVGSGGYRYFTDINPGDLFGAVMNYIGDGQFYLVFINFTEKTYRVVTDKSTTHNPNAMRNSAEWVVKNSWLSREEAPLANFDVIEFNNCSSTINYVSGPIDSTSCEALTMTSHGITQAVPSGLSEDGSRFKVRWMHE